MSEGDLLHQGTVRPPFFEFGQGQRGALVIRHSMDEHFRVLVRTRKREPGTGRLPPYLGPDPPSGEGHVAPGAASSF
uniref:Uncharacterized protein n=1 Tax=Oryza sativa subsp. japonica TaxID=39947 RepID=Q850S7_ORYSJ|nr:hypothetical protein [Oryza sativa Japonica Group]